MPRLGRSIPFALAGATILAPRLAAAEPRSTVALSWRAPPSCPTQSDVERDVVRTIGGRGVDRAPLEARIEVWRSVSGEWNGEIQLSAAGETTTRQVHGASCRAVARAVGLVVGVAAVQDSSPPVPSPTAPPPPPAPPSPPPEPVPFPVPAPVSAPSPTPDSVPYPAPHSTPTPTPTPHPIPSPLAPSPDPRPTHPASPPRFFARAAALLDVGSLPSATPGVEVFVGWKPSWWDVELGGTYLATQSAYPSNLGGQGADLWRAEVLARACGAWHWRRLEAGPCLGANLAWLDATGRHASSSTAGTTLDGTGHTVGATVGGRASVKLTPWLDVYVGADLLVPFVRPTFVITNADPPTVYQPSAVAFRGGIGAEAHF